MKTANYKWNDKVENFNYKLNKLREELNKYKKNAIPESLSNQKNANTTKGKLEAKKREFSVIKNNEVLKNIYKRTNGGCALKDKKNNIHKNSNKKNPVNIHSGQNKYTYSGTENNSINHKKNVYNNNNNTTNNNNNINHSSNNNIKQKSNKESIPNNAYRKKNKKNKSKIKENIAYYNTVANRCLTSRSTYERNGTSKNIENKSLTTRSTYERNGTSKNIENKSLTTRSTNYEEKTKPLQLPTSRANNNKTVKTRTATNTTNISSNNNISNYYNNNNNNNNSTITASATTINTTNNNTTNNNITNNNTTNATTTVSSNSFIPNGNDKKIMEYNKKYNEKKHHVTTKHMKISVLDNNAKKTNIDVKHRVKFLHFEEEDGNIQVYPVYADVDVGFHNITHVDDDNLSQVKKENQDDDDIKTTKRLAEWSSELVYKHLEETIKRCKIVFKNSSIESRTDDLLRRIVE